MRCWRAKNLFSAYLDDELRGRELATLRAHLEECPACRRELAELRALKETVGTVSFPIPAGFTRTVFSHSRLADLVTDRFRERSAAGSNRMNMRLVLVAASVVIIAVGVGLLGLKDMLEPSPADNTNPPATVVREAGEPPASADLEGGRMGLAGAVVEAVAEESGPGEYLSEHLAAAEALQSSAKELSRHVIADEALNRAAEVPVEATYGARFSLVSTGSPITDAAAGLPPLPTKADADTPAGGAEGR